MSVSDKTVIHTLMIYPYLIGLLYPDGIFKKENLHHKIWKSISMLYCVVAALLSVYYMKLDNVAYLKADYQQQNSYFLLHRSDITD